MIHYIIGNIFNSPAQALVNTVNIQGVMFDSDSAMSQCADEEMQKMSK